MNRALLIDLGCLQVGWLTAALLPSVATPCLLLILGTRCLLLPLKQSELLGILLASAFGLLLEYTLVTTGVMSYNDSWTIPLWLPLLWLLFSISLGHSMAWLNRCSLIVQMLIGSVGGALTYLSAAKFQVLDFHLSQTTTVASLGIAWAISMPLLLKLRLRAL